jgi:hypothetical protein
MWVLRWMKKPMTIMGPCMQVLQWMKTNDYYLNLIRGYCNEGVITTITGLYAGIAYFGNIQCLLRDPICGYCIE